MKVFLLIILAATFLLALLLNWALNLLPPAELRRRVRGETKDETAKQLLALQAIGWPARAFLRALGVASLTVLLIWASRESYWLAAVVAAVAALAEVVIRNMKLTSGPLWWITGKKAGAASWLLHWFEPIWQRLPKNRNQPQPSQIYELDDLLALLDYQSKKAGNRIRQENLKTAQSALRFEDKTVAELTTPLREVRLVLPDEAIGPHLMDELHAAGRSAFPVGKKVGKKLPPELSGVVYLGDLVESSLHGNVSHIAKADLSFIAQSATLTEALEIFLKKHTSLLIVKDERDEPVGVVWLEDVLEQILGRKIMPEPEAPADADAREKVIE